MTLQAARAAHNPTKGSYHPSRDEELTSADGAHPKIPGSSNDGELALS
jgi:hypothetical protein